MERRTGRGPKIRAGPRRRAFSGIFFFMSVCARVKWRLQESVHKAAGSGEEHAGRRSELA